MRRAIAVTFAALLSLAGGCDRRQDVSASPGEGDPTAQAEMPPSWDSPRKDFPLMVMPLTIDLPAGWKLEPPVGPSFLKGPAPSGEVEISLSIMDGMDQRHRQLFIAGAIDQSQRHPRRIQVRQSTSKSGLLVVERTTYVLPLSGTATKPATTLPWQQLSWNITLFVPYKQKFIPCCLDLIGLTQRQYELDEQTIRTMVDSAKPAKTPAFP
jgi:hypothetical protein